MNNKDAGDRRQEAGSSEQPPEGAGPAGSPLPTADRLLPTAQFLELRVADTGIGIAPEDQHYIFQEFSQVEHPIQKRVKGAGLGLPLSRKLAELLGGRLTVTSEPGVGSTFCVVIPLVYRGPGEVAEASTQVEPSRHPVLVIEDDPAILLLYEKYLEGSDFQVVPARSLAEAGQVLTTVRPTAVVLDTGLPGEDAWAFLARMRGNASTRSIPILAVTGTDEQPKGVTLGADGCCAKPVEPKWLLATLRALANPGPPERILVIDDDEIVRYAIRGYLAGPGFTVLEAGDGLEGLRLARAERPHIIVLDLALPGASGFEVLDGLKSDPTTRDIPVIILTSKALEAEERRRLTACAAAILSKETVSRDTLIAQIRKSSRKTQPWLNPVPEDSAHA